MFQRHANWPNHRSCSKTLVYPTHESFRLSSIWLAAHPASSSHLSLHRRSTSNISSVLRVEIWVSDSIVDVLAVVELAGCGLVSLAVNSDPSAALWFLFLLVSLLLDFLLDTNFNWIWIAIVDLPGSNIADFLMNLVDLTGLNSWELVGQCDELGRFDQPD